MAVVNLFAPPAAEIDAYVVDASLWTPIGKPWLVSLHALADDDTGLTLDIDGKVEQWDDLSGNGNHLTQPTALTRMIYAASHSQAGGLPALVGTSYTEDKGLLSPEVIFKHAYFVASYKNGTEAQFTGNGIYDTLLSGNNLNGTTYLLGELAGGAGFFKAGSSVGGGFVFKNGHELSADVLPLPLSVLRAEHSSVISQENTLGYRWSISGQAWEGAIRAFALTDGTETEQEKQLFEAWLARRSNILSRLVETHPYRSSIGIQQTLTIVAPSDVIDLGGTIAPGNPAFYTAMPDLATTPLGTIVRCTNAFVSPGIRRDPWFEVVECNPGSGYDDGDRDWDQIR